MRHVAVVPFLETKFSDTKLSETRRIAHGGVLEHLDYRAAETLDEREEIFNLRYRGYLREGSVRESPDKRLADRYDDLPNS